MNPLPSEIPPDLPASATGVIIVLLSDGGLLYRTYDNESEAKEGWQTDIRLDSGDRAYLFLDGVLLAFMSRL